MEPILVAVSAVAGFVFIVGFIQIASRYFNNKFFTYDTIL